MHRITPRSFAYLFLLLGMFAPASLFAQGIPTGSFVVSPAREEVSLDPGASRSLVYTLENGTAYPLHVEMSFEDVAPAKQSTPADEPVQILKDGGTDSLKDLLSASRRSFDIPSGGSANASVAVAVPKDAKAGGRYGSIVFTFVPKSENAQANIAVESRIASLVYLRVNGESHESGALLAFGLFNDAKTHRQPSQNDPVRFQVAYENTGDVHLDPYGQITVKGLWGSETHLSIDPWAVLPGATRMREIDLFGPLSPGIYTAKLELNRGYGDIIDTKEATFYVLPTPLRAFFIIIGLIAALFLLRRSLQLSRHML